MAALASATVKEAMAHPNWDMGQRITIDSASMCNKSPEVIETREFFGVEPEQIEVILHPESLIHSMVGYRDGAIMAHLGAPDMRHSIGYALNWPRRDPLPVARPDLAQVATLTFRAPDLDRYPALRLCREVMPCAALPGPRSMPPKRGRWIIFRAGASASCKWPQWLRKHFPVCHQSFAMEMQ